MVPHASAQSCGLCDAPRAFYELLFNFCRKMGCAILSGDSCVAYIPSTKPGEFCGAIASHVDDLLNLRATHMHPILMAIQQKFESNGEKFLPFQLTGIQLSRKNGVLSMDQRQYIAQEAAKPCCFGDQSANTPLSSQEITIFRQLAGRLNWVVRNTAPAHAAEVSILQTGSKPRTHAHLRQLSRIFQKFNDSSPCFWFPKLDSETLHLRGYSDGSFKTLDGMHSFGGFLIFLADDQGLCHLLQFKSFRIQTQCLSPTAAEVYPCIKMMQYMFVICHKFQELVGLTLPVKLYTDSSSVFHGATDSKSMEDPKLHLLLHAVRQLYQNGEVSEVLLIPGSQNPANALTKARHNGVLDSVLSSARLSHDITEARICIKPEA